MVALDECTELATECAVYVLCPIINDEVPGKEDVGCPFLCRCDELTLTHWWEYLNPGEDLPKMDEPEGIHNGNNDRV